MRFGVRPDNPVERILIALHLVPTPLLDSFGMVGARALLVATRIGAFDALVAGALTADQVAARLGTHPDTTRKLLNFLVTQDYLRLTDGRYSLSRTGRKWLPASSPRSLHDSILMRFVEWDWLDNLEDVVRTGDGVDVHHRMTADQWGLYQRSMRSSAAVFGGEVVRRTPVPKGARDMLDIGGSHGYYSVAICRRHRGLRSVVLDLPEAVDQAAPILAKENMGDRVVHRAGNAVTADLGREAFDLVFMANLVHNLTEADNRDIAKRVAQALRPGGFFVIHDVVKRDADLAGGQMGAMADLYFSLISQAGSWSAADMAGWQRDAGLQPRKPIRFLTLPGTVQQVAVKP